MPFLDAAFVGLLRCPASGSPLVEASLEQLAELGLAQQPCSEWDAGLLRTDGKGVYPVRKGIPVLLSEAQVLVDSDGSNRPPSAFAASSSPATAA